MRKLILGTITLAGAVTLIGCTGGTSNGNYNISVNTNRGMSNMNGNMTSGNSMGNSNINTNQDLRQMNTNGNSMTNANKVAVVQDNFWSDAAQAGMTEMEASRAALAKTKNAEIKSFAQKMIADHTKVAAELKALAAKKSIVLPMQLDSSNKSMVDKMNAMSGADFDKQYVNDQISAHESAVELFEDQSKDDSDADLKAFAAKNLAGLKSHLEMIKAMQTKMK